MGNILDKTGKEIRNTHFMFNNFSEDRVFYEIMSHTLAETEESQMTTIWRIEFT
jgi:hypothetical protein